MSEDHRPGEIAPAAGASPLATLGMSARPEGLELQITLRAPLLSIFAGGKSPEQSGLLWPEMAEERSPTPIDKASRFKALIDAGLSKEQLAGRFGCSIDFIKERLRLLQLAAPIQALLDTGQLSHKAALLISRLPHEEDQLAAVRWFLKLPEDADLAAIVNAHPQAGIEDLREHVQRMLTTIDDEPPGLFNGRADDDAPVDAGHAEPSTGADADDADAGPQPATPPPTPSAAGQAGRPHDLGELLEYARSLRTALAGHIGAGLADLADVLRWAAELLATGAARATHLPAKPVGALLGLAFALDAEVEQDPWPAAARLFRLATSWVEDPEGTAADIAFDGGARLQAMIDVLSGLAARWGLAVEATRPAIGPRAKPPTTEGAA